MVAHHWWGMVENQEAIVGAVVGHGGRQGQTKLNTFWYRSLENLKLSVKMRKISRHKIKRK